MNMTELIFMQQIYKIYKLVFIPYTSLQAVD